MTQQLTTPPRKKLLDEAAFQELLAAAFVLQQHNQLADNPVTSPTAVVSEIVRIQRMIRGGESNLVETARLISEQAQKFTKADGVAIGIVSGEELIYLSAIGTAFRDLGRRVRQTTSLSESCIRTGLTFQTSNTYDDRRMDPLRDYADVRSFIAVPVSFANKVAAVLETRFKTADAFTEGDVHNCELITALVKELVTRAGQSQGTRETQPEGLRSSALESGDVSIRPSPIREDGAEPFDGSTTSSKNGALSKLGLGGDVDSTIHASVQPEPPEVKPQTAESSGPRVLEDGELQISEPEIKPRWEASGADPAECRSCGQHFVQEELFCGKCGMKRSIDADGPLQAKWASLWYMNQARPQSAQETVGDQSDGSVPLENHVALSLANTHTLEEEDDSFELEEQIEHDQHGPSSSAISLHTHEIASGEAASESVHVEWLPDSGALPSENWLQYQWRVHRANFYLGGAALLLLGVLSGLGSNSATYSRPAASGPQLSMFERMLVGMGIAEAPQAVVKLGNPDTPVWVDLHTALYYCPGSEQYGRTDGGKIATQRSAQMDQFEPAHRKVCN